MMNLTEVIQQLIRFRTETGNAAEIDRCLDFMKGLFAQSSAEVEICRFKEASPVFFARNTAGEAFDVLVLGHIDVVPAADSMFEPIVKDGKMYGRGTLDMKSFAAVALHSLIEVCRQALPIRFGVILSTDEEKGSRSTKAFLESHPELQTKIVLDNDVGGDISKIVLRCKNPVFVKLKAAGKAAHGSTPWFGADANERLFRVWQNIRRLYPAYDLSLPQPQNTWIDTVHFATIRGGAVSNIIADEAEALLDFRLIETSTVEALCKKLDSCMIEGVGYQIVSSSTPVVMREDQPEIVAYKRLAEAVTGQPIEFEYIGGATDSREFAERGAVVIMHSGTGEGMHADGEWVKLSSVERIADIQLRFLTQLARGE
jgi:succinyl-diaminopimelate desuccinylase